MKKNAPEQYWHLLCLRNAGCPVDLQPALEQPGPLRILPCNSDLGLPAVYALPRVAAFVLPLAIYAAASFTIYRWSVQFIGLRHSVSWLTPSAQHPNHYCLPPGLWVHRQYVLNGALDRPLPLFRDDHRRGILLGTFPEEDISGCVGKQFQGMMTVEDLSGQQYFFPLSVENRLLDPELLRRMGEAVTFPPPSPPPALTAKPPDPNQDRVGGMAWVADQALRPEDRIYRPEQAPLALARRAASGDRGDGG